MIEDFEPLEKTEELARAALDLMSRHRVPSNPMNYTVWYAYGSQRYPDLSSRLESMIAQSGAFTPEANQELFERYFGSGRQSEAIRDTGDRLQATLQQVLELLGRAGLDTSDYQVKLTGIEKDLDGGPNAAELAGIVQAIATETRHMLEKSRHLEVSLQESASEVEDLRAHLEAVRREALTDALTGIANRKCFDTRLAEAIESATSEAEPLCLLICDIDYFKRFNDTFGHRIGDEVLKIVGRHLQQGIKGQDLVARYGGEEFAIVLPRTPLAGAVALANALREQLAGKKLKNLRTGEAFGRITLSVGAAQFHPGELPSALLERADAALYQAKREGRNRVAVDAEVPVRLSAAG